VAALRIVLGKVIVPSLCLDELDGVNWDWDPMCSNMSRSVRMLEALRRGKQRALPLLCLMSRATTWHHPLSTSSNESAVHLVSVQ
jgi:hypothetical protein